MIIIDDVLCIVSCRIDYRDECDNVNHDSPLKLIHSSATSTTTTSNTNCCVSVTNL